MFNIDLLSKACPGRPCQYSQLASPFSQLPLNCLMSALLVFLVLCLCSYCLVPLYQRLSQGLLIFLVQKVKLGALCSLDWYSAIELHPHPKVLKFCLFMKPSRPLWPLEINLPFCDYISLWMSVVPKICLY